MNHSQTIARWAHATKPLHSGFDEALWQAEQAGATHSLHCGAVSASFTCVPGHADLIRVRARNWRAEDEPHGYYSRADAKALYRALRAEGFAK